MTAPQLQYDVEEVRANFPCLGVLIIGKPLAYLDNAATAQKPQAMIDATSRFYSSQYANVHRGVHALSQLATDLFEQSRERVRIALNAKEPEEVIFTKGCTEAINLVAQSLARNELKPGDEIILSEIEHHSNIVPWQIVAQQTGAVIRVIPMLDSGELDLDAYDKLLSERTRFVAFVHISNAIGTVNPVKDMTSMAKRVGAKVLIDGAQAGPHHAIDVQEIGADFYTLSCHKMYAPTGIGVLYGKRELLEAMPPYQGGGSMIRKVTFEETTYAALPDKFEPGTPNIAGFVGFGATLDYIASLGGKSENEPFSRETWVSGMRQIACHEANMLAYGESLLQSMPGVTIFGGAPNRAAILSFGAKNVHPHDMGQFLDEDGVAVRVGHHCCQPLMKRLGVPATTRASLAMYSTKGELDRLAQGIRRAQEMFG